MSNAPSTLVESFDSLESLEQRWQQLESGSEWDPWRLLYLREDDEDRNDRHKHEGNNNRATRAARLAGGASKRQVRGLAASAWREVNRNVPRASRAKGIPEFVSIARRRAPWRGPSAVLVGLKYRGNVGTIVRSAVQSSVFQEIIVIEERGRRREETATLSKTWGDDERTVSEKDIEYYSMYNALLIPIRRFQTVEQFLQYSDPARAIFCVDIGENSVSLYSRQALRVLGSAVDSMYIVIGAEDTGVPHKIVERASALFEIPSMSASINVSCAFMAFVSALMLAPLI